MSNIKARDRKDIGGDLKLLDKLAKLTKETTSVVHDANKIPNRKQDDIGNRVMGHCLSAYENSRVGNMIFAHNSKDQSRREACAYKCESELGSLVADIKIMNTLVPGNIGGTEWYRVWDLHAIDSYTMARKWREQEDEKLTRVKAAERKAQEKEREAKKAANKRKQEIKAHRAKMEKEIKDLPVKILIKAPKNVDNNEEEVSGGEAKSTKKKVDNKKHRSNFAQ